MPRAWTTTILFVPLARLVFPTPQPLFSREQSTRPRTIRSTLPAAVRSIRLETRARLSSRRPAPPSPAAAASRSRDADTPRASPASEHRSAESTESLPGHGGCRSTDGHPCRACADLEAKERFFFTRLPPANDPTRPLARPP